MNRTRLSSVLLIAVVGTVALAGCKKKEEPAPVASTPPAATSPTPAPATTPAPMTATASVTSVDLGNTVGPDMKIATPMTAFGPKDTIYVSIGTNTSDPAASIPGKLTTKWTHIESNQVVSEESRDLTLMGTNNTEFHIAKPDGWPKGKYRVEVALDGNVVQSREFEVR